VFGSDVGALAMKRLSRVGRTKKLLPTVARFALYRAVGATVGRGSLNHPVFIVGTGRCGTTVLLRLLDSHPELARFPSEANRLWHPALYPYELAEMEVEPYAVDPAAFTAASLRSWPRAQRKRIVGTFAGYHWLRSRGRRLVVKSAMLSFMIPELDEIFPDAQFVHLYRYGPAVVRSYVGKELHKHPSHTESEFRIVCAHYWNSCMAELNEQSKRLGSHRSLEVAYEDLCNDPLKTLEGLAMFLGISPSDWDINVDAIQNRNYETPVGEEWEAAMSAMALSLEANGYAYTGQP
jgi:hypothetical protein